jgi:hypothetical protein
VKTAAAFALLAIASGAVVTSFVTSFATSDHRSLTAIHAAFGIAAVVLVCSSAFINHSENRSAALVALAFGVIECLLQGQTPATAIIHACLAPVLFSICVAGAIMPDSSAGNNEGHSTFRLVVRASPALVLLQIALGAAYRHKAIGVMPHMAGATLVAGFLLTVCILVLHRLPQSSLLRRAAGALLGIVLLQVSLGIAVFVMRLLDLETTPAFLPAAVAHVVVGSLTLAASLVLAIHV